MSFNAHVRSETKPRRTHDVVGPEVMPSRTQIYDVRSLDEVIDFVESNADQTVIICDVDETQFGAVGNSAIDRLEAHPSVARVIALTNGPERDVSRLVSRGNNPWASLRRLKLVGSRKRIVVVGDQMLTDGLLAWRLGAPFLHLIVDDEAEARRQAVMRRVGRTASRALFRPAATGGRTTPWGHR